MHTVTLSHYLPNFCNHHFLRTIKNKTQKTKLTFWFPYSRKLLTKATSYDKEIKEIKVILLNWCSLAVKNKNSPRFFGSHPQKKAGILSKMKQKQQSALHKKKKKSIGWILILGFGRLAVTFYLISVKPASTFIQLTWWHFPHWYIWTIPLTLKQSF